MTDHVRWDWDSGSWKMKCKAEAWCLLNLLQEADSQVLLQNRCLYHTWWSISCVSPDCRNNSEALGPVTFPVLSTSQAENSSAYTLCSWSFNLRDSMFKCNIFLGRMKEQLSMYFTALLLESSHCLQQHKSVKIKMSQKVDHLLATMLKSSTSRMNALDLFLLNWVKFQLLSFNQRSYKIDYVIKNFSEVHFYNIIPKTMKNRCFPWGKFSKNFPAAELRMLKRKVWFLVEGFWKFAEVFLKKKRA